MLLDHFNNTTGYDESITASAPARGFDTEDDKPTLSVEVFPGHVHITGRKGGADSLDIYMRLKGQFQFRLIAARCGRFPLEGRSPLARPGVPETREYLAIRAGVFANERIGQPSDIVTVTCQPANTL